jgi:hypothetical protein
MDPSQSKDLEFILTIENLNKAYDGFRAINRPQLLPRRGRAAHGHRPQRRGQIDLLRPHLPAAPSPTPARSSSAPIPPRPSISRTRAMNSRSTGSASAGKFQTPTSVYTEHTVWDNLVLSLKGPRGVFASLFHRLNRLHDRPTASTRSSSTHPPRRQARLARRPARPRRKAVARDRHAARAGAETAPRRRTRRRHDRRGDRIAPASSSSASPANTASS